MHKLRQRAVRAPHRLCSLILLRKGAGSTADHAVATPSRSFSHRVKGTSMSTFSAEEVAKLQAGGNDVRIPVFVVWERESSRSQQAAFSLSRRWRVRCTSTISTCRCQTPSAWPRSSVTRFLCSVPPNNEGEG
jgi:hypothetical protein